jgi:hypothetical protein
MITLIQFNVKRTCLLFLLKLGSRPYHRHTNATPTTCIVARSRDDGHTQRLAR